MGLFDLFRKNTSASSSGFKGSDLLQFSRKFIWNSVEETSIAENFSIPSFSKTEALQHSFDTANTSNTLKYRSYEIPTMETVNPESIFDIRYADSPNFWNHHGNTKEDYMELASYLPEIQERLKNGESLDSIRMDDNLANTVNAYYNEDKMIQVVKYEDGYQFQDDGRHRLLAAQESGYDVPVKVIGEYEEEGEEEVVEEAEVKEVDTEEVEVKVEEKIEEKIEVEEINEETEIEETEIKEIEVEHIQDNTTNTIEGPETEEDNGMEL